MEFGCSGSSSHWSTDPLLGFAILAVQRPLQWLLPDPEEMVSILLGVEAHKHKFLKEDSKVLPGE